MKDEEPRSATYSVAPARLRPPSESPGTCWSPRTCATFLEIRQCHGASATISKIDMLTILVDNSLRCTVPPTPLRIRMERAPPSPVSIMRPLGMAARCDRNPPPLHLSHNHANTEHGPEREDAFAGPYLTELDISAEAAERLAGAPSPPRLRPPPRRQSS